MATAGCELLVHITAPSAVRDDRRYLSIAQSLLDFQPAILTKVSGPEPTSPSLPSCSSVALGCIADGKDCLSGSRLLQSTLPDLPRLRTAPRLGGSSDGSVAGLGSGRGRRRVCSAKSSPSRPLGPSPRSRKRSTDGGVLTAAHTTIDPPFPLESSMERVGASSNTKRKRRRNNSWHACDDANEVNCPRCHGTGEDSVAEIPSQSAGGKSSSSTATPTPHLRSRSAEPRTALEQYSQLQESIFIALDCDDASACSTGPSGYKPARGPRSATPSLIPCCQGFQRIRQLPDDIRGPYPKGGRQRFTTHITRSLELLAGRLDLPNHFRPALVEREVKALERGYWQFCIRIVEGDTAPGVKRQNRKEQVGRRGFPALASVAAADFALWTEDQFLRFWQSAAKFIEAGKGGWGTRFVKELLDGCCLWRIRVFTWGELLRHLWLVLWILSDKKTRNLDMDWVSGEGAAVIKMSGGKQGMDEKGDGLRVDGGASRAPASGGRCTRSTRRR